MRRFGHVVAGVILFLLGAFAGVIAERHIRTSVERTYFLGYLGDGDRLANAKDWGQAADFLYAAENLNPASYEPNARLGRMFEEIGYMELARYQYDRALRDIERAPDVPPRESDWIRARRAQVDMQLQGNVTSRESKGQINGLGIGGQTAG